MRTELGRARTTRTPAAGRGGVAKGDLPRRRKCIIFVDRARIRRGGILSGTESPRIGTVGEHLGTDR